MSDKLPLKREAMLCSCGAFSTFIYSYPGMLILKNIFYFTKG